MFDPNPRAVQTYLADLERDAKAARETGGSGLSLRHSPLFGLALAAGLVAIALSVAPLT